MRTRKIGCAESKRPQIAIAQIAAGCWGIKRRDGGSGSQGWWWGGVGWGGDGVAARGPDVVAVDGVGGAEAQRDGLIGQDAEDARAAAALLVLALEGIGRAQSAARLGLRQDVKAQRLPCSGIFLYGTLAVKATNQRTQNPPTRERYTSSSLVQGIRRVPPRGSRVAGPSFFASCERALMILVTNGILAAL